MTEEEQIKADQTKKAEQEKMENDNLLFCLLAKNNWKPDFNFFTDLIITKKGNLNEAERWTLQATCFEEAMKIFQRNTTISPTEKSESKNIEEEKKPVDNTPLFLKAAFFKSRRHLLYSISGGGKSLMSIAISNSKEIKKPLFILVDNVGEEDIYRYRQVLGDKAIIVTLKMFEKKVDNIQQTRINSAKMQIMMLRLLNKGNVTNINDVENITNRVYDRMGIQNRPVSVEKIDVLVSIMEDAIKTMNIDAIIIDSINGIYGDPRKLTREKIKKIIEVAANAKVTLVCLHHTNKSKSDYAGSSTIGEVFDYIYRLSNDTSVISTANNESILILEEEKARYSKQQVYKIKCTYFEDKAPDYELLEQFPFCRQGIDYEQTPNLLQRIETVLLTWDEDTMDFGELQTKLGGNPPSADGSIKNCLKKLKDSGKAEMTDNQWKTIKIVR